jgi:hypothetical protein
MLTESREAILLPKILAISSLTSPQFDANPFLSTRGFNDLVPLLWRIAAMALTPPLCEFAGQFESEPDDGAL